MANCSINAVYIDQLIDVSDPGSNVWYDYTFTPVEAQDDITSNATLTFPVALKPKTLRIDKNGLQTEKVYTCNECSATFNNASNLKCHMRIHTGEKPFSCDICNIAFVQSSNLKAHKRIHSGERPYICDECGKSFFRSSHLSGHKRTHTGEMPYSCEFCLKAFATSTQLKIHKQKHITIGSFLCNVCDLPFISLEALTLHKKIHAGEKPFRCTICMASFRSRDDLNTHRKLHPGEGNPYACSKCGKGFRIKICCERHSEKCVGESKSDTSKRKAAVSCSDIRPKNNVKSKRLKKSASNKDRLLKFIEGTNDPKFICKMELLEESIEEGMEDEADEHTVVVSIDGSLDGDSSNSVSD